MKALDKEWHAAQRQKIALTVLQEKLADKYIRPASILECVAIADALLDALALTPDEVKGRLKDMRAKISETPKPEV